MSSLVLTKSADGFTLTPDTPLKEFLENCVVSSPARETLLIALAARAESGDE